MTVSLAVIVTALAALVIKTGCASFIFVDWTLETPQDLPIKLFLLDYVPPIGRPAPNSNFPPTSYQTVINNTLPAADYNVAVSALLTDGSVRMIMQRRISSSPDPPLLDSITTNEEEAIISYFPPEGENLSYYLEYFPVDREEYANFVETAASIIKLRGLQPGRQYRVRILSVFHGVPSAKSIDTVFETKPAASTTRRPRPILPATATPSEEANILMATTNLPASPIFTSTASAPYTITSYFVTATTAASPAERTIASLLPSGTEVIVPPLTIPTSTTTTEATTTSATSTTTLPMTSSTDPATTTTTEPTTTTTEPTTTTAEPTTEPTTTTIPIDEEITTTTEIPSTRKMTTMRALKVTTPRPAAATSKEVTTAKPKVTTGSQQNIATTTMNGSATISPDSEEESEPATTQAPEKYQLPTAVAAGALPKADSVTFAKEGKMLRVSWNQSDDVECHAYRLNYTVTTLNQPKAFSEQVERGKTFALVKVLPGHIVRFETYCVIDGGVTNVWWATGVAEFIKPNPIEQLRLDSVETDEFYQASIVLSWRWPVHHDFDKFMIIVSYAAGETMQQKKDIQVKEQGPFRIDKLNPAQLYTLTVRNVSAAFGIGSKAKGIRQITPPIISSTLYPGEISSTAININFGESDPEQGQFEHYELTFSGQEKNITRKLAMADERSLTFTGLIPGKTYNFAVYTVYKGVRSRPVTANITTYPNKVSKLFPVMGRDYVVLYWEVENLADNDCRYRLSYSGTANTGFQSTSTVELQNKTKHKFTNMNADTYYTFTIIVIMGEGDAEAESSSESTTVGFGPRARSLPTVVRYGKRELAVDFENDHNTFSDTNGVISNYAIIVTEDTTLESDDYELSAWYHVKDERVWPAYRASQSNYNPFRSRTVKSTTFIVGENDCAKRRLDEPYCNGPLRPNVDYYVKIRAYSVSNVAMETEWVSINGLVEEGAEPGEESNKNRRPCHMYLNGCPKSAPSRMQFRGTLILSVALPITLLLVSIFASVL